MNRALWSRRTLTGHWSGGRDRSGHPRRRAGGCWRVRWRPWSLRCQLMIARRLASGLNLRSRWVILVPVVTIALRLRLWTYRLVRTGHRRRRRDSMLRRPRRTLCGADESIRPGIGSYILMIALTAPVKIPALVIHASRANGHGHWRVRRPPGMETPGIRPPWRAHDYMHLVRWPMPTWTIDPTRSPVMHPDTAVVPVTIIEQPVSNTKSNAKRHKCPIVGAPHPQNFRIVARHINNVRLGRDDTDFLFLHDDLLLRRIGQ